MKSVLRLALFLAAATSLRAQGWSVGLKGGLGQGGFTKTSEFSWGATGMNFALSFSRQLTARFAIQPELATSQTIGHSEIGASSLTYTSDDISLPMLLGADLARRAAFSPYVIGGPSVTIHRGCSLQFVVAGAISNIDCVEKSFLSRLDVAMIAGAGVSRTFGSTTVNLELRANMNLRNEAMPDGSGYGRRLGWAFLTGARVPLNALTYRGRVPPGLPAGTFRLSLLGADADEPDKPLGDSTRVSVNASDADVRAVLVTLALQSGVSLIVAENVRGRVSVTLPDTSAVAALRAVAARSGLTMSRSAIKTKTTTWLVEATCIDRLPCPPLRAAGASR